MTHKTDTFHIGQICPTSGVYRIKHYEEHSECSKEQYEIPLTKGKTFPPCKSCKFKVVWEFVRSA